MSKEKRYRLLKDLPDAKAGTILEYDGNSCYDYKSLRTDLDADPEHLSWYKKEFVENNPTWFEEIKEENKSNDSFKWTRELVEELVWDEFGAPNTRAIVEKFEKENAPKPQAENKLWDFCSECNQKNICSFYGGCRKSANAEYEAGNQNISSTPQPQKEEQRCKSDSGHCVNSNVCQELNRCIYIDREEKLKSKDQPDRIEVSFVRSGGLVGVYYFNEFCTTHEVSKEQCEKIKATIEKILNNERWWEDNLEETYSEEDLLDREEKAFYSARNGIYSTHFQGAQYRTFKEYKNANP